MVLPISRPVASAISINLLAHRNSLQREFINLIRITTDLNDDNSDHIYLINSTGQLKLIRICTHAGTPGSSLSFPEIINAISCSVGVKLTDRKIRWIIKEKLRDVLSTTDIARLQLPNNWYLRYLTKFYCHAVRVRV